MHSSKAFFTLPARLIHRRGAGKHNFSRRVNRRAPQKTAPRTGRIGWAALRAGLITEMGPPFTPVPAQIILPSTRRKNLPRDRKKTTEKFKLEKRENGIVSE
jgi:hypothetical protein